MVTHPGINPVQLGLTLAFNRGGLAEPVKIQTVTVTCHEIFETRHAFLFFSYFSLFFLSQESDESAEEDDLDDDDDDNDIDIDDDD